MSNTEVTPEERVQAAEMRAEVAALLHELSQAHQRWLLPRMGSKSTRVTAYVATRALMNAFHLNDQPAALRDAAVRFADEIRIPTYPAHEAFANSGKLGKA